MDAQARTTTWRGLVVVGLVGLLGAYVLLHSPARALVASLAGTQARGCYFCLDAAALAQLASPLAGLALVATAVVAAWVLSAAFHAAADERLLAFGLSAVGLITVPAAALGSLAYWQAQAWLRPPLGPLVAAVPSLVIVCFGLARGWRPSLARPRVRGVPPLVLALGALAAVLHGSTLLIGLTHPPNSGDALSYHAPLAVFLWRDGNLGTFLERAPGTWALAHPGTAELWSGLLLVIGGEALADLAQLPFALLGAVAVAVFTRRIRLGPGSAAFAACAYLLVPMVVLQVGGQANDVVGAGLLMSVAALASAPRDRWSWARLGLIGAGLGLTAVTKLALLPAVGGAGLFVFGTVVHADVKRSAPRVALVGLLFLLAVGPWWARNIVRYGNPVFPSSIPVLGRGVFIGDLGRVDTSFVPSAKLWPLYPALEAHDDRSGFGALVLVGLIPGLAFGALRRPRAPRVLYALMVAFMLPAWWIVTLHEPRFLLGLVGLGFAFMPWVLIVVPRARRPLAAGVLVLAAVFSALVTIDQALLPVARQPVERAVFYDHVWGVDPLVSGLPESEGLLHNTGYAPAELPEYAAYYPLLGPSQARVVVPVDWEPSTEVLLARMRAADVRYAYVLAAAENRARVEAIYDPSVFELVHSSTIVPGEPSGARRHLYRAATPEEVSSATMRYLFRLR